MERVLCGTQRWECDRDLYSCIPTIEKLCNNYCMHPRVLQMIIQTQSLSHGCQGSVPVGIHLSQGVRLKRKCSALSVCVCLTEKPMLCMGRLVNMELFVIGLFYKYLKHTCKKFYSFVRTSDITINCLHCMFNLNVLKK